jgi:hypothetical protein
MLLRTGKFYGQGAILGKAMLRRPERREGDMVEATEVKPMHDDTYSRDLGDGLVLRWSVPQDVERVSALYAHVFRANAEAPLNWHVPNWTRDMFSGRHPHIGPRDFGLVEHAETSTLVASTCLLGYTCEYEGIPFQFGRPEVVATLPEYRQRGLIRTIFELVHAKSDARGDLAQGITGIPNFYRQFGYEYALWLGDGCTVYFPAIPALKKDTSEPYVLREARLSDVPLIQRLWEREQTGALVTTPISEAYWRWAMDGMHREALERWRVYLIAEASGRAVGYVRFMPGRWGAAVTVDGLMVEDGVPLAGVVPSVLRGLRDLAETTKPIRPETPPAGAVQFRLWVGHALSSALGDISIATDPYPYAWYLRVPDLPRFLRHIAPALDRRLAASSQAGYSGELTLDFYRGGLRLAFETGKLTTAEGWQRQPWVRAQAGYPPLVFLQALFGYRSLHELRTIYPDVWAEGDAAALLDALFPKRPSCLVPLD